MERESTMDLELWGSDGKGGFKICEVENRQYGAIIMEALLLAQRSGHPVFAVTDIWLRDMSDPRNPVILDHQPADKTDWGSDVYVNYDIQSGHEDSSESAWWNPANGFCEKGSQKARIK